MKKFIAAEREKSSAQKRGGGVVPLSLDHAELRYGREPAHQYTPERLYERRWALTVIDLARAEVELAYLKAGKGQLFQRLKDLLAGPLPDRTYADIAKELGMTESAVKVAAHRMRRQFRAALSDHIAETVSSPSDVEDELKHLYIAVGNPP